MQIPADRGGRSSVPDRKGETKPLFRSRTDNPRPRRGDPIAKVGNPSGEEKPKEPVYLEPEGQAGSIRKPRPNSKCAHNHREVRQHTQSTWRISRRSQEKMGTGKDSDKPGKSAGTSYQEPRQTERGRRETTTPLRNGRLPPKRKTPPKETFIGDQ